MYLADLDEDEEAGTDMNNTGIGVGRSPGGTILTEKVPVSDNLVKDLL